MQRPTPEKQAELGNPAKEGEEGWRPRVVKDPRRTQFIESTKKGSYVLTETDVTMRVCRLCARSSVCVMIV